MIFLKLFNGSCSRSLILDNIIKLAYTATLLVLW